MKNYRGLSLLLLLSLLILSPKALGQEYEFVLNVKKKGAAIQPTMYGLFFEDINFAADGGLYAELVKNRSFDFPQSLMGWNTFGQVEIRNDQPPFERNPNYLVLTAPKHGHKHTGIENEGYRGMGFKKDASYRFSVWAKTIDSDNQKLRVELINSKNDIITSAEVAIDSREWKKHEALLTSKVTDAQCRLRIFLASKGSVAVEHVSLFPTDTYKGRENGLRKDLAEALAEINPGIFRFPGGCIVEGTDLETRYDWKKSVGPVENRPVNENRWHYTFAHRLFPDYYQSYGMGFFEFFQLAEDMKAEPLPVVNVGLACQYQNECCHAHVPVGELDNYVQDALDLIEFANGDVNSTWGKVRAEMGHPEPFNLKFLGIGNEQWGPEYVERLAVFAKAIRAKYPEIKLIGSSGPLADGEQFEYLWPEMKKLKVDLVDEHYYKDPKWFKNSAARYDKYDRKGPAVFAGEYACHDHESGKNNNFLSALYEAAFMTGLERNADIVHMCTYAPLLAHVDAWQWKPDMIWFDNLSIVKTPNYYVQQLYAKNKGTNVLSLTMNKQPITGQDGLYASAVYDKNEKCYIIKIANINDKQVNVAIHLNGLSGKQELSVANSSLLQSDLKETNTVDVPNRIVPRAATAEINDKKLSIPIPGHAFGVYKVYETKPDFY